MAAAFDHAVHAALVRVGQDVHDAGDRFRSVDRRERTAHDLHLIDTEGGEASPVIAGEVGVIDLDPVPQHECVLGV